MTEKKQGAPAVFSAGASCSLLGNTELFLRWRRYAMRLWTVVLICGIPLLAGERQPMVVNFQDSAAYRWLNHRVLETRLLDDMESLANWSVSTRASSAAVLDARLASQPTPSEELSIAKMALTEERSRDGSHSLRAVSYTHLTLPTNR